MNDAGDATARLRWGVYMLIVAVATGAMLGRILAVNSVDAIDLERHLALRGSAEAPRQRPFLSANDRSRWATVRALVEQGTYAIDDVVEQPRWDTIDMVRHVGRDGREHLYSSKPPLLATVMAGEYWLIYHFTGATLADYPFEIARVILVTFNVVPLLVYFVVLALLAERFGTSDWGRIFMLAAAAFGTFLTTFAVTINNHVPAAVCVTVALWAAVRIWHDGQRQWWYFALAGFFAALAVANELPALAFFVIVAVALARCVPGKTAIAFLPAAAVVAAAALGTNYLAHDSLRPPYMHRSGSDPADNWYDYSYVHQGKLHDSYWRDPQGIDRGEPSVAIYALHATIGHHGIFSLTPIWLLSVWGVALWWRMPRGRGMAVLIALLSIVVVGFYLSRPQIDRNYGGITSALRWLFWLAPLWLLALLPAADRLAAWRAGRGVALLLLALSVMSASYPTWNPWTQPWLYNFLSYLGWLG